MSHQILLLLAMLTLGLAISQRREQVPCRTVRHSAGRERGPEGGVPQPSPGGRLERTRKGQGFASVFVEHTLGC